ncbi:hypothetical protein A9Q75_14920 [Colwellia psychrerythraea]|uniref:Uncharacterized protein n=1 Tax=Colwellia psychrerythraea TaxID=28229 RepID=A0A1Y5E4C6_COLPS|nr:hypothetical protein A9Q75_14920 [Colwellia psychrerythraea]
MLICTSIRELINIVISKDKLTLNAENASIFKMQNPQAITKSAKLNMSAALKESRYINAIDMGYIQ